MSTPTPAPLPAPRRVVSRVGADGQSSIAYDSPVEMSLSTNDGKSVNVGQVWATRESPASVQTGVDEAEDKVATIVPPKGSALRFVDFGPGAGSPMHFTDSIDYAYVVSGAVTMGTSDGKKTVISQGEVIVQLGAQHDWFNHTKEWTRILFVVIEAKPVVIDGKPLEGLHLD